MDVHLSTSQLLYIYNQLYTCRYAQKMYVKYNTDTLNKNYCQALVPNPSPSSPKSPQTQSQPSPTQFKTQINPKGTGADTKIL